MILKAGNSIYFLVRKTGSSSLDEFHLLSVKYLIYDVQEADFIVCWN